MLGKNIIWVWDTSAEYQTSCVSSEFDIQQMCPKRIWYSFPACGFIFITHFSLNGCFFCVFVRQFSRKSSHFLDHVDDVNKTKVYHTSGTGPILSVCLPGLLFFWPTCALCITTINNQHSLIMMEEDPGYFTTKYINTADFDLHFDLDGYLQGPADHQETVSQWYAKLN